MTANNETIQRELAGIFARLEAFHERGTIEAICINIVHDGGKAEQLIVVPPVNGTAMCLIGALVCSQKMLADFVVEHGNEGTLRRA